MKFRGLFNITLTALLLGVCLQGCEQRHEVKAEVTSTQWSCRTMVRELCDDSTFMFINGVIYTIPTTEWRNVVYSDSHGDGLSYSCPRFDLGNRNQREFFYPAFFLNFEAANGQTYQYVTKDLDKASKVHVGDQWTLSVGEDGKDINIVSRAQ